MHHDITVCATGLQQQAGEQLQVARAPCNMIQWQSPKVVTHFPQGAHPTVKAELNVRRALAKLKLQSHRLLFTYHTSLQPYASVCTSE